MAIWMLSLSWALIYSLLQGAVVYLMLWAILKLMSGISANARYHLSLTAITTMLVWFATTLYTQYHALSQLNYNITTPGILTLSDIQPAYPLTGGFNIEVHSFISVLQPVLPWLAVCYFAGLLFISARLSAGMLQLVALRRKDVSLPDNASNNQLSTLMAKLQLKSGVRLLISAKAQVPMVIGFVKPVILMPAAAMSNLTTAQLETILLHELAHIMRHDYLINILQTIAETILFFNPFIWLVSAITRREREHCCDDLVLDHTREPLLYATALAALAANRAPVFTVAATGRSLHLFNRIKRIMEMKKNSFSYSRMTAAILITSAITCSVIWLSPALAQNPKNAPATKAFVSPLISQEDPMAPPANTDPETNLLIKRLSDDQLISEVKGFTVEKKLDELYVDGKLLPPGVNQKYLSSITQDHIWVQVFPFQERLKQHPDANFLQLMAPVSFSSPCVKTATVKKPGC